MEIHTNNEEETTLLASDLAGRLCAPACILLSGPLGSGKSVFARALIRALLHNEAETVPSPTFTLVQTYDTPRGTLWHFDLYRLNDPEEIFELGWEEALADTIAIVEWPERLGPYRPAHPALDIRITPVENKPDERLITILS